MWGTTGGALLGLFIVGTGMESAGLWLTSVAGWAVWIVARSLWANTSPQAQGWGDATRSDPPRSRWVTLKADGTALTLLDGVYDGRRLWADLVAVRGAAKELVLTYHRSGDLHVPRPARYRSQLLDNVQSIAERVLAARAAQMARDEAALERMERGLSRPEDDEHADRGLSVTDGG
ncbi:MAG: hypothetical protein HZB16_21745 [Armatimonadetes bacterium]|nr:hypothetical protein [Armatimonadota bacterium]